MEVGTFTAAEASTGSRTMADLALAAGAKFADSPALRHKVGDEWVDITYAELADKVRTVAAGLIDLGIQPGDKVAILSQHAAPSGPTPASASSPPAPPASRSTRPTRRRSATTCSHHSEARAVFVEDEEQLAKVRAVRDDLPDLDTCRGLHAGRPR